jgi:hypothetical protein
MDWGRGIRELFRWPRVWLLAAPAKMPAGDGSIPSLAAGNGTTKRESNSQPSFRLQPLPELSLGWRLCIDNEFRDLARLII